MSDTTPERTLNLYLDVDFETARALHRVVRAMHDGECPSCHCLFESPAMRRDRLRLLDGSYQTTPASMSMICPHCAFKISAEESQAAIAAFAPVMDRNLAIFEQWRTDLRRATMAAEIEKGVLGNAITETTRPIQESAPKECRQGDPQIE
jgi:hypothetical protein